MSSGILQCLSASLSTDPNTRISAELRISELLLNPATALELSSIVLSQEYEIGLRQMSVIYLNTIVILRKYVNERWSPFFTTFKGNAPPVEVKEQIRRAVFQGLSDPERKIRSACAHTLSTIANSDWPDEYPDLLENLISLLSSTSQTGIHGSMQVFVEFIKTDLTEDQILPVLRQLLPTLLTILGSAEHSPLTRARTVSVFRQCVSALFMVKDQHPQGVKEAVSSILPTWIDAFKVLVNIDPRQDIQNSDNWDGLFIRMEIFQTLDVIYLSFGKALTSHINDFLDAGLVHLQALLPIFTHYYISPNPPSLPQSSEDEVVDLSRLGSPIFDFMSALVRGGKAKTWLQKIEKFNVLVEAIVTWIQMTSEDEETWANDANIFIASEDDEWQPYSLRVAGLELLGNLMVREPAGTTQILSQVISRKVTESRQSREAGNSDWWRTIEAALAALGGISEAILEFIGDEEISGRPVPIDIKPFLSDVVPSLLTLSECPFLQGRSFVFASQYAQLLPTDLANQYLGAAVDVVEAAEATIPIKVSAVKAIHNFCGGMPMTVLANYAARITVDLGPLLLITSEDTLTLILETITSVVDINYGKWINTEIAHGLVTVVLDVWKKNDQDPLIISTLTDILESLASAQTPNAYETTVKVALPILSNAIATTKQEESWIASSAIELVTSMVQGAPSTGLGDGFFAVLAPNLFRSMSEAEDRDLLQNGVVCLTWIVRKDCLQIIAWRDPTDGRSGIEHILSLVAKLLSNENESGGLAVGDLIVHLLRRATDSVVAFLPELLRAMMQRMVTATTATFVQSLVIPFAFLVYTERDTVLNLLENTDINGRSGLDILIQTWCENAETFQGFWPSRISTLGLSQLFASERPSLQNLIVKGDIIVKPETKDIIVTRSRAKKTPHEFTSIPFPVKALKILLRDLQSNGESAAIAEATEGIAEDDEDDDEWADEERLNQGFKEEEFAFLSDMLGPKGADFDKDDVIDNDDDEDLGNDPVSTMDMRAHLLSFIRECAARNVNNFSTLVDQLGAEEMLVVRKILNG